ncbi:transcriptional regulator with XRE-family HTH domain [Desulfohalotomaculum tongense]|uniref:helix-turn-helix domain-containing protein n=1 Tax=Desulforadius tongensis TaxID=1216062 RepID=UPI001EE57261|nr:helix-turn-helix transcriptional regulator [Desulforadius tongensis]MBM7854187.1 transcriptional regulator with XRE-family HTH domain [Desulforadius tongensis]
MPFGDVIKAIRMKFNITQEQLAREFNICFLTINRWKNGHTSPSKLTKIGFLQQGKCRCSYYLWI